MTGTRSMHSEQQNKNVFYLKKIKQINKCLEYFLPDPIPTDPRVNPKLYRKPEEARSDRQCIVLYSIAMHFWRGHWDH